MGARDVLARLSDLGLHLTLEGSAIRAAPKSALTDETRSLIRAHKAELIDVLSIGYSSEPSPDPAAEKRRLEVLDMLAQDPTTRYAIATDTQADAEAALLTLAIRGRAVCELRIPRAKYDPFLLLVIIRSHTGKGSGSNDRMG